MLLTDASVQNLLQQEIENQRALLNAAALLLNELRGADAIDPVLRGKLFTLQNQIERQL